MQHAPIALRNRAGQIALLLGMAGRLLGPDLMGGRTSGTASPQSLHAVPVGRALSTDWVRLGPAEWPTLAAAARVRKGATQWREFATDSDGRDGPPILPLADTGPRT
jgi:hypothetical protein